VLDDGSSLVSLMVHSTKSGQSMYEFDLSSKVGLLGVCIGFNFGYINKYKFGSYKIQSWLELIKMLRSFFLQGLTKYSSKTEKKIHSLLSLLFRKIFSNIGENFLVMQGN
jgi:hypothetical protein